MKLEYLIDGDIIFFSGLIANKEISRNILFFGPDTAKQLQQKIAQLFYEEETKTWKEASYTTNVSPLSNVQTSEELRKVEFYRGKNVFILWWHTRRAIWINYDLFVAHLPLFWRPSEDIAVFDQTMTTLVSLDHEELLTVCDRPKGTPPQRQMVN